MKEITLSEFESNFDEYFERVENGESFLIETEDGKVMIVPYKLYEEAKEISNSIKEIYNKK